MICGSEGPKSRLAKAAGAEPSGRMRDEKLHAVVARSTSRTHKTDHLWKLMLNKCTPLWREAHFEVKSIKNERFEALLDVRMSFCVACAGDSAPWQK